MSRIFSKNCLNLYSKVKANPNRYYKKYLIPKSENKARVIEEPTEELKAIQKHLTDVLQETFPLTEGMAAGKGFGLRHHLEPHCGAKTVVTVDIEDFFPSVSSNLVFQTLETETDLTKDEIHKTVLLTTTNNHVPQGAPSSVYIASLTLKGLYDKLRDIAKDQQVSITVYVDDWAISGCKENQVFNMVDLLSKELSRINLKLNTGKKRIMRRRKNRIPSICNIFVGDDLVIPNDYLERLREEIKEMSDFSCLYNIEGKVAFVGYYNEKQGRALKILLKNKCDTIKA